MKSLHQKRVKLNLESSPLQLFSPAKINLSLKVVRRRSDGFHDLETQMQTVDLGDDLEIRLAKVDALFCDDFSPPCDPTNLIWQAVQLYKERSGIDFSVSISVKKRIPQERGLGGGSSNVATALYGINRLLGAPYSLSLLSEWSASISSDAPFFFSRGSAFCRSKGEIVEEVEMPQRGELYLYNPPFGLSTKRVFDCFDKEALQGSLDEAACRVEPRLRELRHELSNRFHTVFMTGSGSGLICEGGEPLGVKLSFIQRADEDWYLKPFQR